MDHKIEKSLSVIEGKARNVISKIINSVRRGQIPNLSYQEIDAWNNFFVTQWRRTPESQQVAVLDKYISKMYDDLLIKLQIEYQIRAKNIEKFTNYQEKWRILKNVRSESLSYLFEETSELLHCRSICILIIKNKISSFIVESRPLVKISVGGKSDLNDFDVEMWLPVAHDVAIGVGSGHLRVLEIEDDSLVTLLNQCICEQSEFIYGSNRNIILETITKNLLK